MNDSPVLCARENERKSVSETHTMIARVTHQDDDFVFIMRTFDGVETNIDRGVERDGENNGPG